jgi:hypothetical protein
MKWKSEVPNSSLLTLFHIISSANCSRPSGIQTDFFFSRRSIPRRHFNRKLSKFDSTRRYEKYFLNVSLNYSIQEHTNNERRQASKTTHLKASVTEWHGQVKAMLMESQIGFGEHQLLSHRIVKAQWWMLCMLKILNENNRCIKRNEMMVYKLLKQNQWYLWLQHTKCRMRSFYDSNAISVETFSLLSVWIWRTYPLSHQ